LPHLPHADESGERTICAAPDCVDNRYFSRQAFAHRLSGGSLAMPAFAKNPKFIIGTLVVLWVAYVIYANFQIDMVTFYLLPFNILKLQLRLSAVIIGAAIFGSLATIVIHWLWLRPSNSSVAVTTPIPPSNPAPRSSTVA
jgi:hypothetical protein